MEHRFEPRLNSTYMTFYSLPFPIECEVTWTLREAEEKRPKTVEPAEPSAAHPSQQDPAVRVHIRKGSPMARIKLLNERLAKEVSTVMPLAINGVEITKWEFAQADPASILILWEGVLARNCSGHV